MSQVFISYSHKDADFVEELVSELKSAKINYWLDKEFLHAGDHWEQEIDTAIEDSVAFLLVMSPDAKQSEYVTYEWAYAFGVGTKIIPIYLDTVEWHPKLHPSKIQYVDFRESKRPYSELIASILRQTSNNSPEQSDYLDKNKYLALQGDTEKIRQNAIEDIVKYKDEQVPDILAEIIEESRLIDVQAFAAIRLADKFNDKRCITGLVAGIRENNPHHKRAITTIQTFGERAIDGLIELLDAEWIEARYQAVRILGDWKVEKVADKFLELLQTEEPNTKELNKVYSQLATAMYKLGDKRAVSYLIDVVVNRHILNNQVIQVLADFEDDRAIPALLVVLERDNHNYHSPSAIEGLIKLGKATKSQILKELDGNCELKNEIYLERLLQVVVEISDLDFYETVYKLLDCNYPHARQQTMNALVKISDIHCIPKIGEMLKNSKDEQESWSYISLLARMNHETTYFYLLSNLEKNTYNIIQALGYKMENNFPNSLSHLVELLYDSNPEIQNDVLTILRKSTDSKALSAVKHWEENQGLNVDDT